MVLCTGFFEFVKLGGFVVVLGNDVFSSPFDRYVEFFCELVE